MTSAMFETQQLEEKKPQYSREDATSEKEISTLTPVHYPREVMLDEHKNK